MSASVAMIDAMVAAGASAEVLAAAWKAEIASQEQAVNDRRVKDRDRQRNARSRGVTHCPRDNANVTASPSDGEQKKSPQTPKENNPPNDTPKGVSIPPAKSEKGRSASFEVPDWIPAEPWVAFVEMRRLKKKPLDDYTAKQLFGRLRSIRDAGWNINDVIDKATIGKHDGFWMPDGRDSNLRRANGAGRPDSRPMNVEQLRAGIRFAEDHQDPDRAAELKRQLAALTQKPPDPKVAQLIRQATNGLRANG